MDIALRAIEKICSGTWTVDDQKTMMEFVGSVLGDVIVKDTKYGTMETFFGPNRLGNHPVYFDVVGERGSSIFLATRSETKGGCLATPKEILEDTVAIYLVYFYLKRSPDSTVHPLNLLECFCRKAFLRDPLDDFVFNIYYFPRDRNVYYENCVPLKLKVLDVDGDYGLISVDTHVGETTLSDPLTAKKIAKRLEYAREGKDPLFEEALEAFGK